MARVGVVIRLEALAAIALATLGLAACQAPNSGANKDFQPLAGGSFENTGAVIEEPGVFRIVGGQNFKTPFSVDCTKLTADVDGWKAALAAGAHRVAITLPDQPRTYGGVLALCTVHKSATGPSSRSYQLVIPAGKIGDAQDGLIASVAEQVSVNRQVPLDFKELMAHQPGQPFVNTITEDFTWMLWFTDHPDTLGVTFGTTGGPPVVAAPPPPPPPAPPTRSAPPLTKGGSYTVTTALNLRAGPTTASAVVTVLNAGDGVVASGEEKAGFWSVTTVGGQTGWVAARNLKAN